VGVDKIAVIFVLIFNAIMAEAKHRKLLCVTIAF
jgi:hypothetical protein